MNPDFKGKIPLYVTGHSLGGALASLFYYRLRKACDLDDICDVRDAYVFGCPGVGDTDFAMGFARYVLFLDGLIQVILAFHIIRLGIYGG
jgi:hypothetical protein